MIKILYIKCRYLNNIEKLKSLKKILSNLIRQQKNNLTINQLFKKFLDIINIRR